MKDLLFPVGLATFTLFCGCACQKWADDTAWENERAGHALEKRRMKDEAEFLVRSRDDWRSHAITAEAERAIALAEADAARRQLVRGPDGAAEVDRIPATRLPVR